MEKRVRGNGNGKTTEEEEENYELTGKSMYLLGIVVK